MLWRILVHYLINNRKYSPDEASGTIKNWLDKCSQLKRLQFSPNYMSKYNINSAVLYRLFTDKSREVKG